MIYDRWEHEGKSGWVSGIADQPYIEVLEFASESRDEHNVLQLYDSVITPRVLYTFTPEYYDVDATPIKGFSYFKIVNKIDIPSVVDQYTMYGALQLAYDVEYIDISDQILITITTGTAPYFIELIDTKVANSILQYNLDSNTLHIYSPKKTKFQVRVRDAKGSIKVKNIIVPEPIETANTTDIITY